jgi:hypothetical protein
MPTPDDAIDSPVEHESTTSRATCPPDEPRTITAHGLNESPDFHAASNGESSIDVPMQLPTPPPQEPSAHAQQSLETHTKPADARIEPPARDIPTPMTSTDEGAEEQRISQISPTSTITPALTSLLIGQLSSPYPAHRVCHIYPATNQRYLALTDSSSSLCPIAHRPSSAPAAASRAAKHPIGSSTKSRSRSSMSICASHLCVDICASKVCRRLRWRY